MRQLIAIMLVFMAVSEVCAEEVTFLYWSDRHSENHPTSELRDGKWVDVGGAPLLAGLVNEIRGDGSKTLVCVAGDEFTGTPVSTLTRGLSEIKILNKIGIDVFVPGNHEFDHGWKSLMKVTGSANFPIILANVVNEQMKRYLFPPDTVLICSGVRVGVLGLIDEKFREHVIREGVLGIKPSNIVLAAELFVESRRESCDILVALSHMGWTSDSMLAEQVGALDVIIGGHSHTPIDPPREVNGVVIVQSGPYGKRLGRLVVDVDTVANRIMNYRGELLSVESTIAEPDPKVRRLIGKLEKSFTKKLDNKIGILKVDWKTGNRPSNLAQWAVDVMRRVEPRAALAVINSGNLRKNLDRGPIKERDMWEICPFENSIVTMQMTGSVLKHVIKFQLEQPREHLTWNGLHLKAVGGEIESLTVGGREIVDDEYYVILTTGYLWGNLESYMGVNHKYVNSFKLPGIKQRDVFIQAILMDKVVGKPLDDRWDVR